MRDSRGEEAAEKTIGPSLFRDRPIERERQAPSQIYMLPPLFCDGQQDEALTMHVVYIGPFLWIL